MMFSYPLRERELVVRVAICQNQIKGRGVGVEVEDGKAERKESLRTRETEISLSNRLTYCWRFISVPHSTRQCSGFFTACVTLT
jgi:hypothetical protein